MTSETLNSKQKLIITATELIWKESYNAVSVDEICQKAGVQKGSFYHYFPSKVDLAIETMNACMQEKKIKLDEIFSPTRPALDRFKRMVQFDIENQKEIYKELGHVCGCPFATLGSEMASQNEEVGNKVNEICNGIMMYYESALRDLVTENLIDKKTNIKNKAKEIFAFMVGQLLMARIQNDLTFLEKNLEASLLNMIGIKK